MERISRRELIWAGLSAGFALPLVKSEKFWKTADAYAPFKMGIQSYSLRHYPFDEAVSKTHALGLRFWESYQDHVPLSPDSAANAQRLTNLNKQNITLWSWGVQGFDGDADKAKNVFEFAKAMKIRVISADPAPESFEHLERLVRQYNIRIAIHNHGPGARYDKLQSVMQALNGRHPLIGACIDTGHALRSGEDPVDWLSVLGKRVYDVHLKDVKNRTEWAVLGQGDLRVVEFFKGLRKLNYANLVALEYEANENDPIHDIEACLQFAKQAIADSKKTGD